jgi:hypothetical protein
MRHRACWDCEFESRREHSRLSDVNVGVVQLEVSATGRYHIQGSPTGCTSM